MWSDVASQIPYCPACVCVNCTAQRNVYNFFQQREFEMIRKADDERLARMEQEERVAELNSRQAIVVWLLTMVAPVRRQREALQTVAWHMEISEAFARGKHAVAANALHRAVGRLRLLDHPIAARLRAARAIPTTDTRFAKMFEETLPEECTICGGTFPEGRHCKRNSCRRKRRAIERKTP